MKTLKFQKDVGGTSACMKRIIKANKGYGQLSSNNNFFVGIWFRRVKTADEENTHRVGYCRPVNTSQKGLCLDMLEKSMNQWSVGFHLVKKSAPRVTVDRPRMAIGYNYIYQKVLGFIDMEGGRSTEPGVHYLSRYPENYSNVYF